MKNPFFQEALTNMSYMEFNKEQTETLFLGVGLIHDNFFQIDKCETLEHRVLSLLFRDTLGKVDDHDARGKYFVYTEICMELYKRMVNLMIAYRTFA